MITSGRIVPSPRIISPKSKRKGNSILTAGGDTEYAQVKGYPTETDPDISKANINDMVCATNSPILDDFIRMTGRESIRLRREKEVVSTDGETGETEEFVIVDLILLKEEKRILIVEAQRSSLGQAMRQCLVAMKDMGYLNKRGAYGFVSIGKQ